MGDKKTPDFSGYVTKSGIECSDGRTILAGAFAHQDKTTVPLVWQHNHEDPELVLGHVDLEDRPDGTYGYGFFNNGAKAAASKTAVEHGDISAMSILANKLQETASKVKHGVIREVSLVLAGANPGAFIQNVKLAHGDEIVVIDDEAIIFHDAADENDFVWGEKMAHADTPPADDTTADGPTAQAVYDSLSPEQQELFHTMIANAAEKSTATPPKKGDPPADDTVTHDDTTQDDKELKHMTRNLFDEVRNQQRQGKVPDRMLAHDGISERKRLDASDIKEIMHSASKGSTLQAAVREWGLAHNIDNIEILFPDARALSSVPDFDKRRTEWVARWWNGTKKSPFSRVKTLVADITEDEARARGYIKGNFKKGEIFGIVKRTTGPKTVYKKQELDRDDILDVTDFDIIAWLKIEMRIQLDEEIAAAGLIGDGRELDDEDHIPDPAGAPSGEGIRSILHDHTLYAARVNINIDDPNSSPEEIVEAVLESLQFYKGSGSPVFFTTLPIMTMMLLAKDGIGRRLYPTKSDLIAALMVSDIVDVEPMSREPDLIGIIVNPTDYTYGADKGGDVTFFSDFDIDFNKEKYLLEARLSGGLNKIRSALVLTKTDEDDTMVVAAKPTFNKDTGVITIPAVAGVIYKREDTGATVGAGAMAALAEGASLRIFAQATATHYFANTGNTSWLFRRPAAVPA